MGEIAEISHSNY